MDTNKSQCPRVDPPQVDLTSSSADETSVHPDKLTELSEYKYTITHI